MYIPHNEIKQGWYVALIPNYTEEPDESTFKYVSEYETKEPHTFLSWRFVEGPFTPEEVVGVLRWHRANGKEE